MEIRNCRLNSVKAIDGQILSEGGELSGVENLESLLSGLPAKQIKLIPAKMSKILGDIEIVLEDDLYETIFRSDAEKQIILAGVADAEIPEEAIAEFCFLNKVDNYSYRHVLVIAALVTKMAMDLGYKDADLLFLISAALSHDFGKSRIPPEILCSSAFLTEGEIDHIRAHPLMSWLLSTYYFRDERMRSVALLHHERRNGTGYPFGTPVTDRNVAIIQVCDMFDALISPRPYRMAFKIREVLDYLAEEASEGSVDEDLVKLLISYVRSERPSWQSIKLIRGRTSILGRQGTYRHIR